MSKHNNANWDHYKVAGRERPGDDVHHDAERQKFSGADGGANRDRTAEPHIPNQERASQPPRPEDADAIETPPGGDDAADAQSISGREEVGPDLRDDEGFTG